MTRQFNIARTAAVLLTLGVVSACQSTSASKVSVGYYQISGQTTAALDREIRQKGPRIDGGRHAVAVARIKMVPNVTFTNTTAGCRITKAKVAVQAAVTLPQWKGRKTASRELGQAWDNIERYTRLHEAVHVAIAFRFAKQIEDDLVALPAQAKCAQTRVIARRIIDDHLDKHDKMQKKFDADEQKRFARVAKEQEKKRS